MSGAAALVAGGSFLLGSLPFGQVLVWLWARRDLSGSGSGNVGALNALRVSRSRKLGVSVLALDLGKGLAAAWLARALGEPPGIALVGVVAGHGYNPWLSIPRRRVVGGKGFAAAAGALLVDMPWIVATWLGVGLISWLALRGARGIRDEAPASALATLATVPAAAAWHGGEAAAALSLVALLVAPKLWREVGDVLRASART